MTSPGAHTPDPPVHIVDAQAPAKSGPAPLEQRGRRWIFGSFAFCPCHLPLTLGILVTVFGGTAAGAVLRDHIVLAGIVITAAWVAGTWRGFRLVRLGQQGACPLPTQAAGHTGQALMDQGGAWRQRHERSGRQMMSDGQAMVTGQQMMTQGETMMGTGQGSMNPGTGMMGNR